MAGEEKTAQKPKKGPSPVLLILLVLALGFVAFDFLTKEQSTGPASRQSAYERRVPRVAPPLPEEEKTEDKKEITAKPARDPFLPPANVRRKLAASAEKTATSGQVAAAVREVLSSPAPGGLPTPGDQGEPGKPVVHLQPVWTGTIATAEEQVVIIRHNDKSYILQLGETLPGTDYRLVEIRQDVVVLKAPGGQLRLRRIEEAK